MFSVLAFAYQPGASELESKVGAMEVRISQLKEDPVPKTSLILATKDSIITLKSQIVEAKEAELDLVRRQQSLREDNRSILGMIAFGLLIVAIFAMTFLALFARRLELQKGQGVFQLLAQDLQTGLSPEAESDKNKFRVHFIVWLSVIIMFASMCMYLFRVI